MAARDLFHKLVSSKISRDIFGLTQLQLFADGSSAIQLTPAGPGPKAGSCWYTTQQLNMHRAAWAFRFVIPVASAPHAGGGFSMIVEGNSSMVGSSLR
jgi:hypothetical protein